MIRVVLISEIPTPYRLPAFVRLAEHPELDLHVIFLAEDEPDRPWKLAEEWRFSHEVLPGVAPTLRTRRDTFVYEINPSILAALRRRPHDVVVVSGYSVFAEQVVLLHAIVRRRPFVLLSESHLGKARSRWLRAAKRLVLPQVVGRAAAGLATGTAGAAYLAHYGLARDRIRIFPNTIDVRAFRSAADTARATRAETRAALGLPERFVLYVGRLVERKGVLDLLAAHRRLGAAVPPLVVVGDGPLRAAVERADRVQALGFRDPQELPAIYGLADVAVVPSHDEPWGVAVNEALASGVPIVVSDAVGAGVDLVEDGVNGRVHAAGDVDALAAAIGDALERLTPPLSGGRIERWDYEFGTAQFVEAMKIATSSPGSR